MVFNRKAANNDPAGPGCGQFFNIGNSANPATGLHFQAGVGDNVRNQAKLAVFWVLGAIKINKMQPFGALVRIRLRHRDRITAIGCLLGKVSLMQPHNFAANQINRWINIHSHNPDLLHYSVTKFCKICAPTGPERSG